MSKIIKTEYRDRVEYTLDGERHREDGPATETVNGDKAWYLHGKLHREDGPAVKYANGYKSYWVDGERLDFITNDQMLIYYLKYGFLK